MIIFSALVSGMSLGAMYGLIALGFHVTYIVSRTVNFSQGSSVMLGAVLGYVLVVRYGWPIMVAAPAALLGCALLGLLIERVLVRPFVARQSNAWLMATVAGGLLLDNLVLFTFGKEPRGFPPWLDDKPFIVFGVGITPLQLVIPLVGSAVAVALWLVLTRSRFGKALSASVQNSDAARLMGIDVGRLVAATYALSSMLAGLAGLLIAPLYNVHAEMGTLFGLKAFAVAIIGGITHAPGVMAAGLIYGIGEALVTALLGSTYTQIVMFSAVIATLALVPRGLFAAAALKKV